MQTFLPFADFYYSAAHLDNKRLGKQRVEVKQLLHALAGSSKGWANHLAALMWKGYESALAEYGEAVCRTWIYRGFKDSLLLQFQQYPKYGQRPPWLGDEKFHASHRSNLLRKDPNFYGAFNWTEPNDLPYQWPVLTDYGYKLVEGKKP